MNVQNTSLQRERVHIGREKRKRWGGGEIGRDSRRDEFPWITFSLFTRGCNQIRSCEKKKKIRGTIWLISMSRFNLGEHVWSVNSFIASSLGVMLRFSEAAVPLGDDRLPD